MRERLRGPAIVQEQQRQDVTATPVSGVDCQHAFAQHAFRSRQVFRFLLIEEGNGQIDLRIERIGARTGHGAKRLRGVGIVEASH